jgi:hypothetical protein
MRKKLLLLDLALVALLVLLGMRLRDKWLEARQRESVVLGQRLQAAPAPPYAAIQAPAALTASDYALVAQQMLFSADRNPVVVVVPKPEPQPPALPILYGALNIDGPMAIMSVSAGEPHKQVRFGQQIGEYTLEKVTRDEVFLDWNGKKFVKKIHELMAKAAAPAAGRASGAPPAAPAARVETTELSPSQRNGPGQDFGGGWRGCNPGDTTPAGTVANGLRKVVRKTPFGDVCRWEPVN